MVIRLATPVFRLCFYLWQVEEVMNAKMTINRIFHCIILLYKEEFFYLQDIIYFNIRNIYFYILFEL